ncbi:hypothetical protein AMECASPLE_020441 [Ameca splendens]|uniref:Uncharacterized protein n=1 Tax=Ameca splendens TaxID=208324 RepID=A0ABV0YRL7_9TELE
MVILEQIEVPMSAYQTCSVLKNSCCKADKEVRERPTPSYNIQAKKNGNPNVPECNRLLDERLQQTETSSHFSPPHQDLPATLSQPSTLPLVCSLMISAFSSRPTSSSGSCKFLERWH